MTGAEGEGSSHSDRPRRAAPSRSSDALAPVPEDGNARSADIATYKSAPGARVNIKRQRLNKLIEVVNGFLRGRLSAPAVRNFEVLQQEILAEQALINNAGQPQPQPHQPTPTPTPIPTPMP